MKKILTIIGSIISVLAVLIGLLDETLGFWQCIIGEGNSAYPIYLNAFGQLIEDGTAESIDKNVIMILISVAILVGGIMVFLASFLDQKALAIIGSILILVATVYFLYSLPNIQEVADILSFTDKNVFFGHVEEATWWIFVIPIEVSWRLGNGFFVLLVGMIVSLVGSFMSDD